MDGDLNRPSRTDYYIMSVAREVRVKGWKHTDARKTDVSDFYLPFKKTWKTVKAVAVTSADEVSRKAAAARAAWFGGKPKKPGGGR